MEAINKFAETYPGLNMVMCVAPNAITVHADKLPENAPARNQEKDLEYLQEKLTGVTFVDVTRTLKRHNSNYLYYKTDHHWTSLAAAYAFHAPWKLTAACDTVILADAYGNVVSAANTPSLE